MNVCNVSRKWLTIEASPWQQWCTLWTMPLARDCNSRPSLAKLEKKLKYKAPHLCHVCTFVVMSNTPWCFPASKNIYGYEKKLFWNKVNLEVYKMYIIHNATANNGHIVGNMYLGIVWKFFVGKEIEKEYSISLYGMLKWKLYFRTFSIILSSVSIW